MKNKLLIFIMLIGIAAGVMFGFHISHGNAFNKQVLSLQTAVKKPQTQSLSTVASGIPQTISIPKINIATKVESVGMDSQGRMDVPSNAVNTAWYSPGFRPGMKGSAVIDGHYDRVTGAPAVFWNLGKLVAGDKIIVTEDNGKKYIFAVDHLSVYSDNNFPIKEVFAASDVPMLNL